MGERVPPPVSATVSAPVSATVSAAVSPSVSATAERRLLRDLARGCRVSLVMKDTTSFFGDPDRATRWVQMAMRVAEENG